MPLGDFPGELVCRIFSYLPHDHLYECMKVCRLWYREASIDIYRDITLYHYHVRFLERTQIVHSDGTQLGDYVQSLTFKPEDTPTSQKLTQQQFKLLLNNLPQLRVIRFEPNGDLQTIIDYLTYYKRIARFTNIQQICVSDFDRSCKKIRKIRRLHYMANYVSHNHITTLSLRNLDIRRIIYNSSKLLRDLSKFKRMQHLSLDAKNSVDRHFYTHNGIHVASILNACPNLESLRFASTAPWDDFDGQRIYPRLTSLTLQLSRLDESNIELLIKHVPNLKRLSIRMYSQHSISSLYKSFSPDKASKFVAYIKQLDYLNLRSTSYDTEQDTDLFWNLMHKLYDDTFRSNFLISFYSPRMHSERLEFDKSTKTFNVYCEWILQHDIEPDWSRHLHSFKFASLQIENRDRIHKGPNLLDMMQPILLEQQPFISFMNNGARIILDETKTTIIHEFKSGYEKPKIRCAYLSYLKPEHGILPTIGTYNPNIQHITMIQCQLPKQNDCYLIDLTKFIDVHELKFDLDPILDVEPQIYIQIIREDKVKWYLVHYWSVKRLEDMTVVEGKAIIKIKSIKLRHFVFQRERTDLLVDE